MKGEAVKAYKIPIDTSRDLINAYFDLKKKLLEEVLSQVVYSRSGKAHLNFKAEERRRLRDRVLRDWRFAKHYVDSAINSVIGLVKGWIKLYNRGKAEHKPKITKKTVYIKTTLFKVVNSKITITIEPRRRYLEVDLTKFDYLPKDYDSVGGLILKGNELIITFKKNLEIREPRDWASFDVNLTNITAYVNGGFVRFDLRELYHIHRVYELKRRRIQKLSKHKPKTGKRLMEKYSGRERDRAKDFMHKLTAKIVRELAELENGAILENLKNIKSRVLNKSKNLNLKLSKWNCRSFQFMLEYKLKWFGLPVKYVNPTNSSKTCPLCSGRLSAYEDRLMKCKKSGLILDRDVVAVLNLQMWGSGATPKALIERSSSMMGKSLTDQRLLMPTKVYQT